CIAALLLKKGLQSELYPSSGRRAAPSFLRFQLKAGHPRLPLPFTFIDRRLVLTTGFRPQLRLPFFAWANASQSFPGPCLVLCLHFVTDFLRLLHHSKQISTKNFANVLVAVALAHERFRDSRQVRAVFYAFGHDRSIKVRAQADVIGTNELHNMINMFDDFLPAYVGQLSLPD